MLLGTVHEENFTKIVNKVISFLLIPKSQLPSVGTNRGIICVYPTLFETEYEIQICECFKLDSHNSVHNTQYTKRSLN